jgi:hypothetical protein
MALSAESTQRGPQGAAVLSADSSTTVQAAMHCRRQQSDKVMLVQYLMLSAVAALQSSRARHNINSMPPGTHHELAGQDRSESGATDVHVCTTKAS